MTKEETIKLYKERINELKKSIGLHNSDIRDIFDDVWKHLDIFDYDPDILIEAADRVKKIQLIIKDAEDQIAELEKRIEQIDEFYF